MDWKRLHGRALVRGVLLTVRWRLIQATLILFVTVGWEVSAALGQDGLLEEHLIPPAPAPAASRYATSMEIARPMPAVTSPAESTASKPRSAAYTMVPIPGARRLPQTTQTGPTGRPGRMPTDPSATHSRVTPAGHVANPGGVTQTHFHKSPDSEFLQPLTVGADANPPPLSGSRFSNPGSPLFFPTERLTPPTILGSHLGLQPGETATERSLRLMNHIGELQSHVDALSRQNAESTQQIKQKDEQLLLAIREIKAARKEVATAREELERLRDQIKALQDKVRDADRDNAALLQTMAPLLQKLLEADEASPPQDREEP